jgi:hypothetical protein
MLYSENTWWIDIGVFSSGWDDFVLLLFFGRPESFDPGLSKIPEASILESIPKQFLKILSGGVVSQKIRSTIERK